ncbi:CBS domain-containing membrane protein [Roseateles sp. YR242]|uniref:HPP family protein n=1 Tax=Roseateles sp. YR242 TaxID=1855305 RepID=UPI0008B5FE66|nr:HPP family protein [Roseateles sp. YR242]SEK84929.1 CBS domain-containing membrane protein [Roseateles sp. YR242]
MSGTNSFPKTPRWDALRQWLLALRPAPLRVDARERLRVVAGASVGLLLTACLTEWLMPHGGGLPWLVAPLGASAVLVFGVPASPLAQPWAVVAGNTASALVGIACVHLLGDVPEIAAAAAVGLAIGLMFLLRCLHPPGGAAALLMVLTGVKGWTFALEPVLLNSCLLVAAGMAYNSLSGRRYPHPQVAAAAPVSAGPTEAGVFGEADLEAALAHYNQVLDVPPDDLRSILNEAGLTAARRRITTLRCSDVMSTDLKVVEWGTPLQDAWALLREHQIKALPVIDRARRVVGIVTLNDFMREASLDVHDEWPTRLRRLILPTPTSHSDKPEVVGQIMTRQVRVASADRPLAELVPLFADTGHHHIPVVGPEARLVGILTQSDLVAALARMDRL